MPQRSPCPNRQKRSVKVARERGAKVTSRNLDQSSGTLNENDIGEYRTFFKLDAAAAGPKTTAWRWSQAIEPTATDRHHRLVARSTGRRYQASALRRTRPMVRSAWKPCCLRRCACITCRPRAADAADRRHVDPAGGDLRSRRRFAQARLEGRHHADRPRRTLAGRQANCC